MSDEHLFSNKPFFCQQNISVADTLRLEHFDILKATDPVTGVAARCGDPLLGTLMQKHIVHELIRCGGDDIDLNFMMDLYPATDPTMVSATTWYNRYMCDIDYNIYSANTATAAGPGLPVTFNLLKSNHAGSGQLSIASVGLQLVDKDNMIWYTIQAVDTTVNYGHGITVIPNDETVTATIKPNKQYLILPFRMVGGCACPVNTNSMSTLGYAQALHPVKVRRDWRICIDILKGYPDDIRYAVTFDSTGKAVDNWLLLQEIEMRRGIKMGLNMLAFIGSPTTNETLLSGVDATIDSVHTGFYGMVPTIKYGGGKVYPIRRDVGFDMEWDFEPIMLYNASRKLSKKYTALHGMKFRLDVNDRSNKMVLRNGLGISEYDAFRRKDLGEDGNSDLQKLGITGYLYNGWELNFKEMQSWSDYRFVGSDRWNSTAIFMPTQGITENGKRIPPIEFYNYGNGQWTGAYEEHFVDERETTRCEFLSGYATQALGMGLHCPDQWILIDPVDPT